MNWIPFLEFFVYALLGVFSFLLWWGIYEWVLTREVSTREAIFGPRPNSAVALDLLGGFLAIGVLNYAIISGPALASFTLDVEATALQLVSVVLLLGILRILIGGFLRLWFANRRDAQGDIVTINNELFRQRNLATGLFSTALYLILVAGLVEVDLINLGGYRVLSVYNMLGVWLTGLVTVVLHSWFYLGFTGRHDILRESFHDNNPAAPMSLLGLLTAVLVLNHLLLGQMPPGMHFFNSPSHWGFLVLALASVLVLRGLLYLLLWMVSGVNLRRELVVRNNPAWGILDGGLIFSLFLIFIALIT